eukprot:2129225-Amphidinium_carterae.2
MQQVISERFQIPDDVAGATLMALGCNGRPSMHDQESKANLPLSDGQHVAHGRNLWCGVQSEWRTSEVNHW